MFKLLRVAFYGATIKALINAYLHTREPSLKITVNTRVAHTNKERKGCHKNNR